MLQFALLNKITHWLEKQRFFLSSGEKRVKCFLQLLLTTFCKPDAERHKSGLTLLLSLAYRQRVWIWINQPVAGRHSEV